MVNLTDVQLTNRQLDFNVEMPGKEELTVEEAKFYSIVFDSEVGAPVEVNEDLKRCIAEFIDLGLNEDEKYPLFVDLAKEAMDHDFDSVERDRLHVINESSEIICRHKTEGRWKVVTSIKKPLIRKFESECRSERWRMNEFNAPILQGTTQTITITNEGNTLSTDSDNWSLNVK